MSRLKHALILVTVMWAATWADPVPTTLDDFFLPGSQPQQSGNLEHPSKCDNCHGGYDLTVEPAFTWRGGMMSQAARDPLFFACLAISNQDAPDAGDLCIRCHSPAGWLEGRSVPTDGSALNNNDRESVQCDFCHKVVKPTQLGTNPYPDDPDYTSGTYPRDQAYLATLDTIPEWSANGMYIADSDNSKRGPFLDANARHQMFYSPFHSDADLCGTCHDVSNPVYTKTEEGDYVPNAFGQPAPDYDPYSMFPIERTFSEWKMSDYNTPEGVYAPQFGGNKDYVSTCQDCHMRDVTGYGCNKSGTPLREDLPLHDQTGGNTFVPALVADVYPAEVDLAALDAGIVRATYMLENAATLDVTVAEQGGDHLAQVTTTNETGHKLPSGYPEGRRIWLNVRAYDADGSLIYESGAYDFGTGELIHDPDIKVYEIKPGISESLAPVVNLPAGPSFHFVLNDTIYSDNRIPPRGFTNANFEMIQSPPVGYSYADGQYWDDTEYLLPGQTAEVIVILYYQTTSKEYVEFLRDENRTNDWGNTLYDLWVAYGRSAPVAMATDTVTVEPTLPKVSVEIIPDNPPVQVPPGGFFRFTATLINNTAQPQTTDAWIMVDVPGIGRYGPVQRYYNIPLAPDDTLTYPGVRQSIPSFAPLGTYTYSAYVGDYPSTIVDSSWFEFQVVPPALSGVNDWNLSGWLDDLTADLPSETSIVASYPNPFNVTTEVSYYLPEAGVARFEVFDIGGRKVATLVEGWQTAGEHSVQWSAEKFTSGVYFVRLSTGRESVVRKLTLLK
jgi:hypothetical protein